MEEQLDWHYHTFHKLIFFLGGQSGYGVEGRSYPLEPGDVILVPQGCVHRPEAAPGAPYERVILYLSPDYLARAGTADCPLDQLLHARHGPLPLCPAPCRKNGRRCAARSSRWRVPPCSRVSGRSCWQSPF